MSRKKIGEILIEKGYLDASQLSLALELKRQSDKKIGQILVAEGIVTSEQVSEAFSEQTGI
ncbi:MAG TPA: GspE/PulE family protein, partial [bacterium]|nr:GspE/PulE family protein [bacterium]